MKESLQLIIDYLENPSNDTQQDSDRRAKLCSSLGLNPASKPGLLGEKIVEIYYKVQNIPYKKNVKVPVKRIEPILLKESPKKIIP